MGAIGGLSTAVDKGVSVPQIATLEISDSEILYNFPVNTKQFKIFNDGKYLTRLAYLEGATDTDFFPLYPYEKHSVYGILAASVTIYVQSSGPTTLRIEIWT